MCYVAVESCHNLKPLVEPTGACGAPGSRRRGCAEVGLEPCLRGRFNRGGCNRVFIGLKSDLEIDRHPWDEKGFLLFKLAVNEDPVLGRDDVIALCGLIRPAKCGDGDSVLSSLVIQAPILVLAFPVDGLDMAVDGRIGEPLLDASKSSPSLFSNSLFAASLTLCSACFNCNAPVLVGE